MLCEPILAFVKAFRLRGDANALKQAALGRFNSPMLAAAKKTLWDACTVDLSSLELPFIPRRSSEKRSQASADLEDILLASINLMKWTRFLKSTVRQPSLLSCPLLSLIQFPCW